jgi:Tfp pilus assembly protein PilF
VSPGNAEAYSALAEMARSAGDLAGARANYTKALATSPNYSPAMIGLADTEWDLGDRAAAQRHYRDILAISSSPPERAKTRASDAAPQVAPKP